MEPQTITAELPETKETPILTPEFEQLVLEAFDKNFDYFYDKLFERHGERLERLRKGLEEGFKKYHETH